MKEVLECIKDAPIVLKGGTCLLLYYGLDRFSEDLDFDAEKKPSIINKLKRFKSNDYQIDRINVRKDTETVFRCMVYYRIKTVDIDSRSLKIEISLRAPVCKENICTVDGVKISIKQQITNKLNTIIARSKVKDLYDMCFLLHKYPEYFSEDQIQTLGEICSDIDDIYARYKASFARDNILGESGMNVDLSPLILELAEQIKKLKA